MIGWGVGELLARGDLIDLFPEWYGDYCRFSHVIRPANVRLPRSGSSRILRPDRRQAMMIGLATARLFARTSEMQLIGNQSDHCAAWPLFRVWKRR
jgi:hypothetical protein